MNEPEAMVRLYLDAIALAIRNKQVVGEKNDRYITLYQLESLIKQFIEIDHSKLASNSSAPEER